MLCEILRQENSLAAVQYLLLFWCDLMSTNISEETIMHPNHTEVCKAAIRNC